MTFFTAVLLCHVGRVAAVGSVGELMECASQRCRGHGVLVVARETDYIVENLHALFVVWPTFNLPAQRIKQGGRTKLCGDDVDDASGHE